MRKLLFFAFCLALAATLLFGCNSEAGSSKLQALFKLENIGTTVAWFEKQYGPAKREFMDQRVYEIDGCPITVRGETTISSLTLEIASAKCSIDLKDLVDSKNSLPVYGLTFGQFEKEAGASGLYGANCLTGCGNAYVPSVWLDWGGSRSMDFLTIRLSVALDNDQAISASNQWEQVMINERGEDWVINGTYNEDRSYNDVAREAFQDVPITSITIGNVDNY